MADLNREISIRSILKPVIVLVVITGQGAIEYMYIIVLYKKTRILTQRFFININTIYVRFYRRWQPKPRIST